MQQYEFFEYILELEWAGTVTNERIPYMPESTLQKMDFASLGQFYCLVVCLFFIIAAG